MQPACAVSAPLTCNATSSSEINVLIVANMMQTRQAAAEMPWTRAHRIEPEHAVHGGSADHHLIMHRHAASHQPRVSTLQRQGRREEISDDELVGCSTDLAQLACGTTASRRSLQWRSSADTCSVVLGFKATRDAPSNLPIQSLHFLAIAPVSPQHWPWQRRRRRVDGTEPADPRQLCDIWDACGQDSQTISQGINTPVENFQIVRVGDHPAGAQHALEELHIGVRH